MNDGMGEYVARQVIKAMLKKNIQVLGCKVLVLGFSFKENCPDIRNTRVYDIYRSLKEYNIDVEIDDPWVSPEAVRREYGIEVKSSQTQSAQTKSRYDAVILAVAHNEFKTLDYSAITAPRHVIYDVKWLLGDTATDKL